MNNDLQSTQPILENIFPRYKEYPMNSMTPAIGYNNNEPIVSMLILADDFMLEDFQKDKNNEVDIEINCYTERNQNGIGQDLVIRFDFYFKTGHPMFETVVTGDLLDHQKRFVEALKQLDEFIVWIVDKDYNIFSVMELSWDYEKHEDVLEPLLVGGLG